MRDPDKQSVYYAEALAFDNTLFDEPLHTDDFVRLADRLFSHDWWERHNVPIPFIEPTTSRDTTSYALTRCDQPGVDPIIRIAPCHIDARTLAHEAAHIAQYHFYKPHSYGPIESHGREFRATYLSVVEIVLGRDAADALRSIFAQLVKVRPEHAPGMPGSIMCVPRPRPEHDPAGIGLFPQWRAEQYSATAKSLTPTVSAPRINGAISL